MSRKLERRGDVVIGHTGQSADGNIFAEWYFAGADMENLPTFHNRQGDQRIDFAAFVLKPDGWEYWDDWFYRDVTMQRNPYMAIGSGAEAALGALYIGATAVEAVKAACASTLHCSPPVEHEDIGRGAIPLRATKA